jgi:NADH-quinone oxidoreductase subunit J
MNIEVLLFFFFAALSISAAMLMITRPNPVQSVLFLIVNFFCLAVLYLLLNAQFIAVVQIIVYAGAIMVLFLFVVMLLNLQDEQALQEKKNYKKLLAFILAGTVFVEIIGAIAFSLRGTLTTVSPAMTQLGTVEGVGKVLFTDYLFPFEITSILLLAAMVGVIVLAKKKFQEQ